MHACVSLPSVGHDMRSCCCTESAILCCTRNGRPVNRPVLYPAQHWSALEPLRHKGEIVGTAPTKLLRPNWGHVARGWSLWYEALEPEVPPLLLPEPPLCQRKSAGTWADPHLCSRADITSSVAPSTTVPMQPQCFALRHLRIAPWAEQTYTKKEADLSALLCASQGC